MRELWSIDVPWACFGLVAQDGVVVEVAPIANWATGKTTKEVLNYFRRKDAKIDLVWRRENNPPEKIVYVDVYKLL
jgi:hypothetical protein